MSRCCVCNNEIGWDAPSGVCSTLCLRKGQGFQAKPTRCEVCDRPDRLHRVDIEPFTGVDLLLCDGCYHQQTGRLPYHQPNCSLDKDHYGECES